MTRHGHAALALAAIAAAFVTGGAGSSLRNTTWKVSRASGPDVYAPTLMAIAEGPRGTGAVGVKCVRNGTPPTVWMTIVSDRYLGGDVSGGPRYEKLTYQLDAHPPVTSEWKYNDNTAELYADDTRVDQLALALMTARRITIRAGRRDGTEIQFGLNVSDAAPAINQIYDFCRRRPGEPPPDVE